MIEFFRNIYLLPLSLEVIAAIAATFYYKKYRHTKLKFILPYLWFIVFLEFSHWILSSNGMTWVWQFNLLTLAEYTLYFYIYSEYLSKVIHKKVIRLFWIIFYVIFIIDMLFLQPSPFLLYNNVLFCGSFFLATSIILYFKEILNSDKVLNLRGFLLTWISVGMLFYHVVSLPMAAIYNNLSQFSAGGDVYIQFIYSLPSIILYTTYILGFVCSTKEYNY